MAMMTVPQARENFFAAMQTLRSSKVRSALTVLGLVIAFLGDFDGLNHWRSTNSCRTKSNRWVRARTSDALSRRLDPSHLPERIRSRKYFEYDYADRIREAAKDVNVVTTFGTRGFFLGDSNLITSGDHSVEKVIIRGTEPEYSEAIPLFSVERGRFISKFDEQHARPVVVLGASISESLFPYGDPIGKEVRINGSIYEVIGVFEHDQGLFVGPGVDVFAVIPLSNFKKAYPGSKELILAFTVPEGVNVQTAQDAVVQTMRRLRRLSGNQEDDFEVSSPDFLSKLWGQLTGALVILTTVISSIGLLVGGIGVMNIMLISVTERTQEIGVRKAIGARKRDILLQFTLAAITLTALGGVLGVLVGAIITWTIPAIWSSLPARMSFFWAAFGLGSAAAEGLLFGIYPAWKAASLDPIASMLYE
jgi:putative ABC transport system permease protein